MHNTCFFHACPHNSPLKSNGGFILPATVTVLLIATLAASFFAFLLNRRLAETETSGKQFSAAIAVSSTRAKALYLLATCPLTPAGLDLSGKNLDLSPLADNLVMPEKNETLPLDNSQLRGIDGAFFSLQDEQGLQGVNIFNRKRLDRLLAQADISPADRTGLIDKLLDYTDPDDFHRLNGAEKEDYEKNNLPPPPNRLLYTVMELRSVMDWGGRSRLWRENWLPDLVTISTGGILNLNTAPLPVLLSYPGVDNSLADTISRFRPFFSLAALRNLWESRLPFAPLDITFQPSPRIRLTLSHPDLPWTRICVLKITPLGKKGTPWLLDSDLNIPQKRK